MNFFRTSLTFPAKLSDRLFKYPRLTKITKDLFTLCFTRYHYATILALVKLLFFIFSFTCFLLFLPLLYIKDLQNYGFRFLAVCVSFYCVLCVSLSSYFLYRLSFLLLCFLLVLICVYYVFCSSWCF